MIVVYFLLVAFALLALFVFSIGVALGIIVVCAILHGALVSLIRGDWRKR